ncbi:MAG TPA: hypothetical protein VFX70_10795, partial [Mycobacteriales bacterium]|nr:hypothetical protein [Mycobacteriales bacterium]
DAISPKASTQPHTPEPAETRPDPVTPTRIASTPPAAPAVPTPSPRPVPAPGTPPATPAAEAPVPHARRGEAPGPGPEAGHPYPASGAPAGPVGSWLPDLPRRPSPRPIRPNTNHAPAPPAAPTPVANRPDQDADQPAEPGRPVLPQRRAQTHVAPQLRDAPAGRRDTPGHTPGLMAAFQGGVSRADEEDDSVANADGMP